MQAKHVANSKASRFISLVMAIMLAIGLIPAGAIAASPSKAYAADGQEKSVDVERYVEDRADTDLVGDGRTPFEQILSVLYDSTNKVEQTDNQIIVNRTLVDANEIDEGETFESLYSDPDLAAAKLIANYQTIETLYEASNGADYYVAFVNSPVFNGAGSKIMDWSCATYDTDGNTLEGAILDAENGLIYIPKTLYAENAQRGVQIQLLQPQDLDDIGSTIEVVTTNNKADVTACAHVQTLDANAIGALIEVPLVTKETAHNVSLDDISVTLNDNPIDYTTIVNGAGEATAVSYDPGTGILTVSANPASLSTIGIEIAGNGVFGVEKAYASVSPAYLNQLPETEFTELDLDSLIVGDRYSYMANTYYKGEAGFNDALNNAVSGYIASYGGSNLGMNNNSIGNWMANGSVSGGEPDYYNVDDAPGLSTIMVQVSFPSGEMGSNYGVTSNFAYDSTFFSSKGLPNNLPLFCSHIDILANGNGAPGYRKAAVRILDKGSDWVTIGVLSSQTYTQSGFAAYNIKVNSKGKVQVRKRSANADITAGNACYSLQGIKYDIYSDASCSTSVGSVVCDANGNTDIIELMPGTYYARENQASTEGKGYAWDSTVRTLNVVSGEVTTLNVTDKPQNDPAAMWVGKIDLETTLNMPQGSASLEGAEFTVRYYDGYYDTAEEAEASGEPTRTWVVATDADGFADLSQEYKVSGDALYFNNLGLVTIPLGTVLIQETKAPVGYLIGDDTVYVRQVKIEGNLESVETYDIPTVPEQVKRGDLEFVKTSERSMARLANVPFRLTSETTGENHILVTDENGYVNTSSNWNPHSQNTNGNDAVEDEKYDNEAGVWFGQDGEGHEANLNDEVGALPYDTYTLEELPCSANEGHKLISLNGLVVKRDSKTVQLGTLDDQSNEIFIGTTAYDGEDLDKNIAPDPTSVVIDNVEYMNVIEGKTYTMEAQLMYAESGEPIQIDGKDVVVTKEFTPTTINGKLTMTIPFNAVEFAGESIVVFERLYLDDKLVGEHSDPADPDQIVRILEPAIGTTAVDGEDGDKTLIASNANTIIDTVEYTNLVPGKEYTVSGSLMVKTYDDEGNVEATPANDAEGNPITASATFTPSLKDGSVKVEFTVPAELYDNGCALVVYETLLRGDATIAVHEDPNDEGQTVNVAYPQIATTAFDKYYDGKVVVADANAGVRDMVAYENLVAGGNYELYGILMNKATELPLQVVGTAAEDASDMPASDEGAEEDSDLAKMVSELEAVLGFENMSPDAQGVIKPVDFDADAVETVLAQYPEIAKTLVTSEGTFTAEKQSGTAEVDFSFDASQWIKDDDAPATVVYELLVKDGRIVAVHTDINDEGQTVQITPSTIGTTAYDKTDGDHEALPSKETTIVDRIDYKGLVAGKEYTITGKLMLKETGEQLVINDKPVEATTTFVPNDTDGFTEIEFTFDSTGLLNKEIVAFESVSKDDVEVAVHADIDDEGQTVIVKNPPDGTGFFKTGGETWVLVALILIAAGIATYFGRKLYLARKGEADAETEIVERFAEADEAKTADEAVEGEEPTSPPKPEEGEAESVESGASEESEN